MICEKGTTCFTWNCGHLHTTYATIEIAYGYEKWILNCHTCCSCTILCKYDSGAQMLKTCGSFPWLSR
jgi:hypothetical protein